MDFHALRDLNYPKPNLDDYYAIYEFERNLADCISNGKTEVALELYMDFFNKKTIHNIIDSSGSDSDDIKVYLISIGLLICHNVIKKGVSPYSAKAKHHAFSKLIKKTVNHKEIINIGKMMIQAYAKQVIHNNNSTENKYIRKAINYINDNLGEDLDLDAVAQHAGLSKCYFCTKFKEETNMSFTDYLSFTRIEKSKYLLCSTDKSILDIAILIGFNSQGYFSQQFKKYTGVSPREFRDSNCDITP